MNISTACKRSTEQLLAFITQLQEKNIQLQERVKVLEDEITRLKKVNTKPDMKPNTKPSDNNNEGGGNNREKS